MSMVARLRSFVAALIFRRRTERDMLDEWQFHLDARTRDLIASGVPCGEAEARARREFGDQMQWKQWGREAHGLQFVDDARQDAGYAIRQLSNAPMFTGVAILTLALGIGANTAIFSVVNAIILRQLPVRDAERLTVIATHDAPLRTLRGVSFSDLQDYRVATAGVFEDIIGYSVGFLGLAAEGGHSERVLVTWVTGNYFPLLDVRPTVGRLIRPDEGGPGGVDAVVVLGYSTWQRRFGGDPSAVGRTVRVNGRPCTVVGVVSRDFVGTFAFSETELYLPLNWAGASAFENRRARGLHAIARLRPQVTIEKAQAAMTVVVDRLARVYPDSNAHVAVRVLPERFARPEEDQYRSNARSAALMLALVALVMIVAAVNVTNLLLARGTGRRRELAVRAALGAGRGRLVRQLLTESLVLTVLGGIAGVVLGTAAARVLATVRPPGDLPVRLDFELDGRVMAYAVSVALITALIVGLAPALRVSGADLDWTLRQSRGGALSADRLRLRGVFVIAQIAVCFVLLVAGGLFVRSLFEAKRADLGFRPEGILNVHMDVGQVGYTEAQGRVFFDDIKRRVQAIPGVQNASFAFTVPMGYIRASAEVEAEEEPAHRNDRFVAGKNIVSSEYFQTVGIQILRGRSFDLTDNEYSRRVAIVNEHFAEKLWPDRNPVGRRFRSSKGHDASWIEVVGVTNTGRYTFLFEEPQSYFFVPITQEYTGLRVLHVRSSLEPAALAPTVERVIRSLEPGLPLYDVQSMTKSLGGGLGFFPVRVAAAAAATLGLLAFALAVVGLYGVISYVAGQRSHEIGVRRAVGATEGDIVRLVLYDGVTLVVAGLASGLAVMLLTSRVIGGFLFGISATDPLTFLSVAPTLGCAALVACAVPAWRAARADPAIALRSE